MRPTQGHTHLDMSSTSTLLDIRIIENGDIPRVAKFLSSSMFGNEIPTGQFRKLIELETQDLQKTYATRMTKRKFPAVLLVAEADRDIIGCIGVDCQLLNIKAEKFSRIPKPTWDISELKSSERICMVLANLAVRGDQRGKGYAKQLVETVESLAKEFQFQDLYLLVDSTNMPAQKLYQKLGYKKIFEDEDATCVATGPLSLKTQECINFCFYKSLVEEEKAAPNNPIAAFFSSFFGKNK